MKKNTIILIAACIAAIVAVWYFFIRKDKKAEIDQQAKGDAPIDNYREILGHAQFPLKKGSRGIEVMYYQAFLNVVKNALIVDLDGNWGQETEGNSNEFNNTLTLSKNSYDFIILGYYDQLNAYLKQKGAIKNA